MVTVGINDSSELPQSRVIEILGNVLVQIVLESKGPAAIGSVHVMEVLQREVRMTIIITPVR